MNWSIGFTLLAAACASKGRENGSGQTNAASRQAVCGGPSPQFITDSGVGNIRVGDSVEIVRHNCTSVSDTIAEDGEAIPRRQVFVVLGSDTLDLAVDSGRIANISVTHAGHRTRDSLGVGITIRRLLLTGMATGLVAEEELYVTTAAHCGMSFRLDYEIPDAIAPATWTSADLRNLPTTVRVRGINVFGCSSRH